MKAILMAVCCAALGLDVLAAPSVSDVRLTQADVRSVVVTYTLSGAPAIVTLDVETNGCPVGGVALSAVSGDVAGEIAANGAHRIEWTPPEGFPVADAKAIVRAYPPDDPPAYAVVALTTNAPRRVQYFSSTNEFFGGFRENAAYWTTKMVLRRIPAADVEWTMGSGSEFDRSSNEAPHAARFDADYYLAVAELTQGQFAVVAGGYSKVPGSYRHVRHFRIRPCDGISYNRLRASSGNGSPDDPTVGAYPNAPAGDSFLGMLRGITAIDFDLPSEAQWEYACRAGHRDGVWNDGARYSGDATTMPGRCNENGGYFNGAEARPPMDFGPTNGTALVCSYAPNAFGLYDLHGNVTEICLDWYSDDISALGGAVNVSPSDPMKTHSGADGVNRVMRGGGITSAHRGCRAAVRTAVAPSGQYLNTGARIACGCPIRVQEGE